MCETPIVLPANTQTVVAIQDGPKLIIYVEAYINIGSRLIVVPQKVEAIAPLFRISEVFKERSGTGHTVRVIIQTKEAFEFDEKTTRLRAITAKGLIDVDVVDIQVQLEAGVADELQKLTGQQYPGWVAIHDFMPIGKSKLTVTGTITTPTTGWTVAIEKYMPIDHKQPDTFYLRVVRVSPTGPAGDVVLPHPLKYVEITDVHYKTVHIEDGANTTVVNVQEVH